MSSHNNRLKRPMNPVNPANGIPLFAQSPPPTAESGPTCGGCKHWHELPQNQAGQGECRERIHAMPVNGGRGFMVYYPPVPASFVACGQFQPNIELKEPAN